MSQDFLTYLLPIHNFLRWDILVLLLIAIIIAFSGLNSHKPFIKRDKIIGLLLMISAHLNLLIGLYLWFIGDWGLKLIKRDGFGAVMKDSGSRFWAVEHITGMLIAIILITLGSGVSKKNYADSVKHRKTFWFFFIALIIIMFTVPWPFRAEIARPWLRGW